MSGGEERGPRGADETDERASRPEPDERGRRPEPDDRAVRPEPERDAHRPEPEGREAEPRATERDRPAAGEAGSRPAERPDEGWADRPVAIPLPGPRADEADEVELDRPLHPPEPRRPLPLPPPLERPEPIETRRPPPPEPPEEERRAEEGLESPPPEAGDPRGPGAAQPAEADPPPQPATAAAPSPAREAEAPRPDPADSPAPPAALAEPPEPPEPPASRRQFDAASLAAASVARSEDEELRRSYDEVVRHVERYVADGYDPIVLVGYPQTGKTHGLKALSYVLRGFEEDAREELQRDLAPGPTEAWPFYRPVAAPSGARWVFVDIGGELYAVLRRNDWSHAEAAASLLHTVSRARALLLMVNLKRGHMDLGPSGTGGGMSEAETRREEEVQRAHEELGFLDQFLLFVRALRRERADVEGFLRKVADAPSIDAALREYRGAPRLDVPVAVLFTQADRLAEGGDFTVAGGDHLAPQSLVRVTPFVARHLPGLFASLLRHARRFKFDFVQSYVERPAAGGERPVWFHDREHLSVGLLPAVEFLERNMPPRDGRRPPWDRGIDTRTALRIHRLLHPGLWRGVEVDF